MLYTMANAQMKPGSQRSAQYRHWRDQFKIHVYAKRQT